MLLSDAERERVVRFSNREVIAALFVAGAINMAMVIMAAGPSMPGYPDVAEIETAYHTLTPLLGAGAAAGFFCLAACVGHIELRGRHDGRPNHYAGLFPPEHSHMAAPSPDHDSSFCRGGYGRIDATKALVLSQVVLSLALPVPMIALLILSSDRRIMGRFATGKATRVMATACAGVVLILNAVLLYETVRLAGRALAIKA